MVEIEISERKSSKRAGFVLERQSDFVKVSTIDFDVTLFFDRFDDFLRELPELAVNNLDSALNHACGVNDQNHLGWSAIMVAAYHGRLDLVKALIERGAEVNDRNFNGTTVLMYAKDHCLNAGNTELFEYLLAQGADIGLRDYSGKTVADYLTTMQLDFFKLNG